MPNGQFHGRIKTGIKITNPLPLAVSVIIKSPTGALRTGDGKETWRTIKPGETLYIPTKGKCEVDISPSIIHFDTVGNSQKLGDASFQPIQRVASGQKPLPKSGPVFITGKKDIRSGYWVTVAQWVIPKDFAGHLRAISVGLDGSCEARVLIRRQTEKVVKQDTTLNFGTPPHISEGESVRVKAHSVSGIKGTCNVMIEGELYPVGKAVPGTKPPKKALAPPKKAPERITEQKKRKEPEEPELLSLGEMIEKMRKQEEVINV